MAYQMILIMETKDNDLRAEAHGWGIENPRLVDITKHIGFTPAADKTLYRMLDTPMHALAQGWRLMAPPVKNENGMYDWWFSTDIVT